MNNKQLRELIIKPTLLELDMYSKAAEDLVAGTIAQESRMGEFIKQIGGGPALGICQMEPATHNDLWQNYITFRHNIGDRLFKITSHLKAEEMIWNLRYAVAMCRIHYYRQPGAIPSNIEGLAAYWKAYYNTPAGKGSEHEFIENYQRYAQRL